jgi:uncharacterized protein DUF3330
MDKSTDLQPPTLPSDSHVACAVCHHEIPLYTAAWREGSDYVVYFCGLECYDRWRNQSGGL